MYRCVFCIAALVSVLDIARSHPEQSALSEEVCEVCGHVYHPLEDCGGMGNPTVICGAGISFDALPDTWRCPICGVSKNHYKLVHLMPTSAPSQQPEEVCDVCGHGYNPLEDCGGKDNQTTDCGSGVPFESLPDAWRCPVCGVSKNHYKLIHLVPTPSPSQLPEEMCDVCGHEYNPLRDCGGMGNQTMDCGYGVPFESLPAAWRCPVCGVSKSHYKLVHRHTSASPSVVPQPPWEVTDMVGDAVARSGIFSCIAFLLGVLVMVAKGFATKKLLLITFMAASAVWVGELALSEMPALLRGHAVGMLVCWASMTIGSVLYRSLLKKAQARVPHAIMQSFACLCAVVGVACIFENHRLMRASQFGLDTGTPFINTVHAIVGWGIVAYMFVQGGQGYMKFLNLRVGKPFCLQHARFGRAVLLLASGNIVIILWSFQVPMGRMRAFAIGLLVVLASILACLISGPRPTLARIQEDSSANDYTVLAE